MYFTLQEQSILQKDFYFMTNADLFRNKFYPEIKKKMWNDWHWQLTHRLTGFSEIARILDLSDEEKKALEQQDAFPTAITPYYASLLNASVALRKTMLPSLKEKILSLGETNDPLGEEPCEVCEGLIHRYPDRVLFLTTQYCSAYCRYCTRSRLVGRHASCSETAGLIQNWKKAFFSTLPAQRSWHAPK